MIKQKPERNNLRLFLAEIDVKLISMGFAKLKLEDVYIYRFGQNLPRRINRVRIETCRYLRPNHIL